MSMDRQSGVQWLPSPPYVRIKGLLNVIFENNSSLHFTLPPLTAPPPSVSIDGPSTILAGQTVVLVCNVSRDVMVTWSREDGRPLPNTPDGNVLRITMPAVEDGGVYRCSVEGVVATFNLIVVEEPPIASEKPMYTSLVHVHVCHHETSKTITHCIVGASYNFIDGCG